MPRPVSGGERKHSSAISPTYAIIGYRPATDRHLMSTSSPYSVAIAYSVRNSALVDPLNYYLSEDGGLNFDGPTGSTPQQEAGKVDIWHRTGRQRRPVWDRS